MNKENESNNTTLTYSKKYRELIPEDEYNRIYYNMTIDDFNTSYPSKSRIERIARGIDDYLRYKSYEKSKKERMI